MKTDSLAVCVVGGVNVDIGGRSAGRLVPADSNPGTVTVSAGGVGRNIAHNLCLLGAEVTLLSAWGDDEHGRLIASVCAAAGMDIRHVLTVPGKPTSTYLYIADRDGDMAVALSDMAVASEITPAYLESKLDLMNGMRAVVADANIPEESLRFLAEHCGAPLFVDPVSAAKAGKLLPLLGRIHTLKPNRIEAELMTGIPVRSADDAFRAGRCLLDRGVKRVFLSLGADGGCAVTPEGEFLHPCIPGRMAGTTGCGDAFMAALVWAFLHDLPPHDTLRAALAAASVTMESASTISPDLNAKALRQRMESSAADGYAG